MAKGIYTDKDKEQEETGVWSVVVEKKKKKEKGSEREY